MQENRPMPPLLLTLNNYLGGIDMLTFRFSGADGRMVSAETLTSGMVGKKVRLEFSPDWEGLTKTVVFMAGKIVRDVVDAADEITIPAEVLAVPMHHLHVGVYGVSPDGRVTPTVRAEGPRIEPGADPSGDEGAAPALPVWAQLRQQIDELRKQLDECAESATFIPAVSADGILSWTNDKGLENPSPVNIKGADGTAEYIPAGWQAALEDGADEIHLAMENAGRDKSAFLFYTDAHFTSGNRISPHLLNYLYRHTPMNKTVFGGDIVDEEPSDAALDDRVEMAYLWDWRNMIRSLPNHHSVAGNHDDGNPTTIFDKNYVYAYLLASEETGDTVYGGDTYYYIDDNCERTRYLYLDTGFTGLTALSVEQSQFISQSLESAPKGWHIVVVSHVWYVPDYTRYSERPVPLTGLSDSAKSVAALLDSYNANRAETDARVEFCIGGHIHYDYIGATDGGIPIVCCETDSSHIRGRYPVDKNDPLTAAAVSGIVANYADRTLHVIRIGRGESFAVDLDDPIQVAHYTITRIYTNVIDDSADTQIAAGKPFTAQLTATLGQITNVTVTMGGTDITASAYDPAAGTVSIASVTGDITVTAASGTGEVTYSNVLTDVGYSCGRVNSSGVFKTDRTDRWTTGFIDVTQGDTLYFKNIVTKSSDYGCNIIMYDSTQAFISGKSFTIPSTASYATWYDDGSLKSCTINIEGCEYVRFCFVTIDDTSVITINEPID